MANDKIRFPFYDGGKYESLEELTRAMKNEKWNRLYLYICDIVEYNVRYRDCLRDNGIDGLMAQLCAEAPSFRNETEAMEELREWHSKVGRLAGYDIQCHGIDEDSEVLGRTFHGLKDIRRRVEMYAREDTYRTAAHPLLQR